MARRARSRSAAYLLREVPAPEFQQERAKRSYDALLEAATALFEHHGYDAVGTPEIAARAGVSVGTFYRYFDDKHEVYLEIMRRTMIAAYSETLAAMTPERFVGRERHETISTAVDLLFHHVLTLPALTRSFMEMSLRDPEVAEMRRAFEQLAIDRLASLIAAITPRSAVADPEAFAYVVYGAAMHCGFGLAVQMAPTGIDRERARKALTTVIERALFP